MVSTEPFKLKASVEEEMEEIFNISYSGQKHKCESE